MDAFLIGGHGNETNKTFVVPAGCVIIVHMNHADTIHRDDHRDFLYELSRLDKTILHNPLSHIPTLLEIYKKIAVYQAGDRCPDFVYSLFDCLSSTECYRFPMGIIDMDHLSNTKRYRESEQLPKNPTEEQIVAFFSKAYKHSIYPTEKDVQEKVKEIIAADPPALLRTIYKELDKYRITQSELCDLHKGVYYHSVCRSKKGITKKLKKMLSSSMISIPEVLRHQMRRASNGTKSHKKSLRFSLQSRRMSNTLKNRIGEVAAHRTSYVKQWMNSPAYQEQQLEKVEEEKETIERKLRQYIHARKSKIETMQRRNEYLLSPRKEMEEYAQINKEQVQKDINRYTNQIKRLERNHTILEDHEKSLRALHSLRNAVGIVGRDTAENLNKNVAK